MGLGRIFEQAWEPGGVYKSMDIGFWVIPKKSRQIFKNLT